MSVDSSRTCAVNERKKGGQGLDEKVKRLSLDEFLCVCVLVYISVYVFVCVCVCWVCLCFVCLFCRRFGFLFS